MTKDLEYRFKQFVMSINGAESIDMLLAGKSLQNERRADYFLANRRVIIELKTLKSDPSLKIEKELGKHCERHEFPLIYGTVELSRILGHLPDGDQINQRIYRNVTRSVEHAVKSTEEQIDATAKLFGLEGAVGLLVLLNEGLEIMSPEVVGYKVNELLSRHRQGITTPIHFTWMLFESHVIDGAHPCVALEGPTAYQFPWFAEALDKLQKLWESFNGSQLVNFDISD